MILFFENRRGNTRRDRQVRHYAAGIAACFPTSTFFTQRSVFDISLNLVIRLPSAGRYLLFHTLYIVLGTSYNLATRYLLLKVPLPSPAFSDPSDPARPGEPRLVHNVFPHAAESCPPESKQAADGYFEDWP